MNEISRHFTKFSSEHKSSILLSSDIILPTVIRWEIEVSANLLDTPTGDGFRLFDSADSSKFIKVFKSTSSNPNTIRISASQNANFENAMLGVNRGNRNKVNIKCDGNGNIELLINDISKGNRWLGVGQNFEIKRINYAAFGSHGDGEIADIFIWKNGHKEDGLLVEHIPIDGFYTPTRNVVVNTVSSNHGQFLNVMAGDSSLYIKDTEQGWVKWSLSERESVNIVSVKSISSDSLFVKGHLRKLKIKSKT